MPGSRLSSARYASPLRLLPYILSKDNLICGAWPRAAATVSTMRASMGGPPRGEGQDRCGMLARVIVATAGVSLRLSWAPWLLVLQLLQFPVDRAQTPLTGHVLPPAHHEGAPPAGGPPLATGSLLQIGEPSMDGLPHQGPPAPLLGPHGCGHRTDLPGTMLPWSVLRWNPPARPTREWGSRGPPPTPLRIVPQAWWAPDKPRHDILSTGVNMCRPDALSSTSRSNHAGKRQHDAAMHDRPCIGIEGLPLIEHGRHRCTLTYTKSGHSLSG